MDTCGSQDRISVRFPPATSDEGLVAVAKLGDRSAFAELWKRHSRTAFTKVYQITKNRADTEDVIQDAWIKAFIHLNAFDGRAKFSTWLTRIAINSAIMSLRRRRSRPEASSGTARPLTVSELVSGCRFSRSRRLRLGPTDQIPCGCGSTRRYRIHHS
jgi:RNA polymerase sigma-70 factor (ECF subfamily)